MLFTRRLVFVVVCLALTLPAWAQEPEGMSYEEQWVDGRLPAGPEVEDARSILEVFTFFTVLNEEAPTAGEPVAEGPRPYVPLHLSAEMEYSGVVELVRHLHNPVRLIAIEDLRLTPSGDGRLAVDGTFHAHYRPPGQPPSAASAERRVAVGREQEKRRIHEIESLLAGFAGHPVAIEELRLTPDGFHLTGRLGPNTDLDLRALMEHFGADVTALETATEGPCTTFALQGRTRSADTDRDREPDYTALFHPPDDLCTDP